MKEFLLKNTVKTCCIIFSILIIVHAFEAVILRMDETFFGENFINKLFGILILWIVLRILQWKWNKIGFSNKKIVRNITYGLLLAATVFLVAYIIEYFVLKIQGNTVKLGFFTTSFSLNGESEIHTGIGFILMCVCFNIINVIMEEGTFRGLFFEIIKSNHSMKPAILIQSLLFGIWHVVTPFHNYIDGDINIGGFIGLSIGYIILAGIMGIKWSLMYQMTGSLYAGMTDHFFNNCVATNLLHITTNSGTDELMIIRVMIAQFLSFAIIMFIWEKYSFQIKDDVTIK